jgi:hypothetical protein
MVKAFAATIGEGNVTGEAADDHAEKAPAVIKGRKKPP